MRWPGRLLVCAVVVMFPLPAYAGMPSFDLTELGRVRLENISFFVFCFLVCAFGVKAIWNHLRQDFPRLPRLTYRAALGLLTVWGLLFLLVLTMISGARELMTPKAWEKAGTTYRLNELPPGEGRR